MTSSLKTARLPWIDTAKGIGIFLVVLGHCFRDGMLTDSIACAFVYRLIYCFHMSLYFTVSGITFGLSYQKYLEKPGEFLTRRVRALLIPLLSYAGGIYLCFFAAFQIPALQQALRSSGFQLIPFRKYLLTMLVRDNPYSAHLWYMLVLLVMSLLTFAALRLGKDSAAARRSLYALAAAGLLLASFLDLPVTPRKLLVYFPWFCLGLEISRRPAILETQKPVPALLGWAGLILYTLLKITGRMPDSPLPDLLMPLAALPVVLWILGLAVRLGNCSALRRLGEESYAVYLLHQPFCCGFAGILLYSFLDIPIWLTVSVCLVLSFLLPMAAVRLCRKIPLLGKAAKALLNIS